MKDLKPGQVIVGAQEDNDLVYVKDRHGGKSDSHPVASVKDLSNGDYLNGSGVSPETS